MEVEILKLMKKLRHNEAQMGESWIIFMGIKEDKIIKVTEFASGLRDGYI